VFIFQRCVTVSLEMLQNTLQSVVYVGQMVPIASTKRRCLNFCHHLLMVVFCYSNHRPLHFVECCAFQMVRRCR